MKLLCALALVLAVQTASAATVYVSNTGTAPPCGASSIATCNDLQDAIDNEAVGGDTISFVGTYLLTSDITINKNLDFDGDAGSAVSLLGQNLYHISITSASTVTFNDVSFDGGFNSLDGGCVNVGGGSSLTLALTDSTSSFTNCRSLGNGGAFHVNGALATSGAFHVTIEDNRAALGGGVYYAGVATFDPAGLRIIKNFGGGLYVDGTASLDATSVANDEEIHSNVATDFSTGGANINCNTAGTCTNCAACAGPFGVCPVGGGACSCTHPDGSATLQCGCPDGTYFNATDNACTNRCPFGTWNDGIFTESCFACSGASDESECGVGAAIAASLDSLSTEAAQAAYEDLLTRVGAEKNATADLESAVGFEVTVNLGLLELDIADAVNSLPEFPEEEEDDASSRLAVAAPTAATSGLSASTLSALTWIGAVGVVSGAFALVSVSKALRQ